MGTFLSIVGAFAVGLAAFVLGAVIGYSGYTAIVYGKRMQWGNRTFEKPEEEKSIVPVEES